MPEINVQKLQVKTVDGYTLSASIFTSSEISNTSIPAVFVAGATGVLATFYSKFATFLARQGCVVMTFDYRGIGPSKPEEKPGKHVLSGFKASVIPEWGQFDQIACLKYLYENYARNREICLVCHSVGGHIAPFSYPFRISRVVFISVNTAFHGNYKINFPKKIVFNGFGPSIAYVLGYFPASKIGLGEDLPTGVGTQWASWGRRRGYLTADDSTKATQYYNTWATPILAISFTDDHLSTIKGFGDMMALLPNCNRTWYHIDPTQDIEPPTKIGHHGYFMRHNGEGLKFWEKTLPFIMRGDDNLAGFKPAVKVNAGTGGFEWIDKFYKLETSKL